MIEGVSRLIQEESHQEVEEEEDVSYLKTTYFPRVEFACTMCSKQWTFRSWFPSQYYIYTYQCYANLQTDVEVDDDGGGGQSKPHADREDHVCVCVCCVAVVATAAAAAAATTATAHGYTAPWQSGRDENKTQPLHTKRLSLTRWTATLTQLYNRVLILGRMHPELLISATNWHSQYAFRNVQHTQARVCVCKAHERSGPSSVCPKSSDP